MALIVDTVVKLSYPKLALSALLTSAFILALGYSVILGPPLLHRRLESLFPDLFYTREPWLKSARAHLLNEREYFYLETTNEGWEIGAIPQDYEEEYAQFYP